MLLSQRRHIGPVVIDMCDTMSFKNLLLLRPNQTGIANLNGVAEVFRELAKLPEQSEEEALL